MKRILCLGIVMLLVLLTGCGTPGALQTNEVAESVSPAPTTVQDAIAAASADELRGMISKYKDEGNYELMYAAAARLTELDPSDTDAYLIAMDALLAMSRANVEEINGLLAQGAGSANNPGALTQWATDNQIAFGIDIPFAPDYASAEEINLDGIAPGNQTNAAKYGGLWRGGLMSSQGDWTYFSRTDEDFMIYKMRSDGSEYQRVGEAHGSSLNVMGDWLYFINTYDSDTPYRMRTDGSLMEKLSEDDCSFLSVEGDYMYYDNGSDEGRLYKTRIGDPTDQTRLTDGTAIFTCVADGWVYYCEKSMEGGFCRVSVDGGNKQVLSSKFIQTYCIADGWVYYVDTGDPSGVWRVRTDGTDTEMFFPFDFHITTINVVNGTLIIGFGVTYEEDGFFITEEVVMIDIATQGKVGHIEENTEAICIGSGGSLYFQSFNENLAWYRLKADESLINVG